MNALSGKNLKPFPGFAILEPYELKRRVGGFELPKEDSENTPQIGKILQLGNIPIEVEGKIFEWYKENDQAMRDSMRRLYMPFQIGMVVAYKKYQDFPIQLGTKKYIAVGFEHILFQIDEANE
jgi:co-chaperonin GroES (HSP10)